MFRPHVRPATALVLAAGLMTGVAAQADFTYQGQLKEAGQPVNGARSLTFNLYDAATGGTLLATANFSVDVTEGVFSVALPWDAQFRGADRWIEVVVQGSPLSPRTLVTPAPLSEFSRNTRGLNVDGFGRIGIGTANPAARLDVRGNNSVNVFAGDAEPFGVAGFLTNWNLPQTHAWFAEQGAEVASILPGGLGRFRGGMELGNTTATDRYLTIQTGQSLSGVRLRNLSANSGWTVLNNPTSPAGSALQFLFHNLDPVGAPQMSLTQWGNLGIGTTTPIGRLDVRDGPVTLTVNGNQDRVTMYLTSGSGNLAIKNNTGSVVASMTSSDYGAGPSGEFRVNNSSGQYRGGISVNANGKCVVEGDIVKINGGADIAESFDVLSAGAVAPQPGMVVSIDAGGSGKLRVSHAAYDRAVAGIISGADGINPGLTLGQKGSIADGEYPVAMTGRVYVFVDAEAGGPVKPGDLLTTSATPGYAMRVTDFSAAPGATIGKAMTGLESGQGLVLVLVGLR